MTELLKTRWCIFF